MPDYKAAFEAASLDLSTIMSALGFVSYPGIDPMLRAITNLALAKAEAQALREQLEALRARFVVPDGYALVPVEPTREMFIAVNKEDDKAYAGGCDHGAQFDWLWDAALEAAPRLNGKAVSDGLLRETVRSVDDIFWAIHAKPSCQSGVVARCRCRLCAGTRLAMARDDLNALLGEGKEHE
ncbi:hypothetical protein [Pseudomonas nitroreducens]|uniref:Uncharacterized protein n=1 Tax=Pseudomonas nitroreducens TaxID=46680 RepID=A0A6G6IUF5_PSENT|nr:hypothetical protein [Pseudomonas nitroreducens]QIE86738.1 hypothetical protein G5B91_10805 [Pseudomonas nitroreducens]